MDETEPAGGQFQKEAFKGKLNTAFLAELH